MGAARDRGEDIARRLVDKRALGMTVAFAEEAAE
jgi:hypothetical protein